MKIFMTLIMTLTFFIVHSQDVTFTKSTMRIDEPYKKDGPKKDTFNIELKAEKIPSGDKIQVRIQKSSESTYTDSLVSIFTQTIDSLTTKNIIKIVIATESYGDEDKYVLLSANWTINGELKQIKDTLFIKNTYPFKGIAEKDYTDWNDGKRVEIFIGSNFDFLNSKVNLSDWYGGVRVFLPSITDVRFNKGKSNRTARWGFAGGIYHARSLSNFGNDIVHDSTRGIYSRITGYVADSAFIRYDTVNTKTKTELNNWGFYFTPLYHYSRFESNDGKFITNMYVGLHTEVIRRNISNTFTFDTIGFSIDKRQIRQVPRSVPKDLPRNKIETLYDAYFGICAPLQFLWKDIIDMKINPCFGLGSRGYSSQISPILTKADLENQKIKQSPWFYLVQFDLLARLGGIRLNIGGEVRGYFPKENPIITAYLGTSFSIQKLVDFVTK